MQGRASHGPKQVFDKIPPIVPSKLNVSLGHWLTKTIVLSTTYVTKRHKELWDVSLVILIYVWEILNWGSPQSDDPFFRNDSRL